MKTNPNEPSSGYGFCTADGSSVADYHGLTKREYFAGLAMQAYASVDYVGNSGVPHENIAEWAVNMADALINELNKEDLK